MQYSLHETEQRQKDHPPSTLLPKNNQRPALSHRHRRGSGFAQFHMYEQHIPTCGRPPPSGPTKQQIKRNILPNMLRCAPPHRSTSFLLRHPVTIQFHVNPPTVKTPQSSPHPVFISG